MAVYQETNSEDAQTFVSRGSISVGIGWMAENSLSGIQQSRWVHAT